MTDVNFPSIALCKEHGLDTGEYVRNIFNNLDFVGFKGSNLKREFQWILYDTVMTLQNAQEYWHWLGYLHCVCNFFFIHKLSHEIIGKISSWHLLPSLIELMNELREI